MSPSGWGRPGRWSWHTSMYWAVVALCFMQCCMDLWQRKETFLSQTWNPTHFNVFLGNCLDFFAVIIGEFHIVCTFIFIQKVKYFKWEFLFYNVHELEIIFFLNLLVFRFLITKVSLKPATFLFFTLINPKTKVNRH